MPTRTDCLDLIDLARKSSDDPESAYVLRARLNRSILSVGQWLADELGLPGPTLPEDLWSLTATDQAAASLLTTCTTVLGRMRSLCQPSEALDERWRRGWESVTRDLDQLRGEVALFSPVVEKPKGRQQR